jgi:hypothetical protein
LDFPVIAFECSCPLMSIGSNDNRCTCTTDRDALDTPGPTIGIVFVIPKDQLQHGKTSPGTNVYTPTAADFLERWANNLPTIDIPNPLGSASDLLQIEPVQTGPYGFEFHNPLVDAAKNLSCLIGGCHN